MQRILGSLALVGALTAPVLGGDCSSLGVDVSSDGETQTVTVDVSGAPANAMTFLAVGDTLGETAIDFGPLGGFVLGLEAPFALLPIGGTDGDGNVTLSSDVPVQPSTIDLNLQALSVGLTLVIPPPAPGEIPVGFDFCTSNVASVTL